jgi:fatty-acid desaturase
MRSKNIKNAILIAVVVGTILNTINSYDVIWESNFTFRNILRIVLTYITPFCVATYSSKLASKSFEKTNTKNTITEK